MKKIAIYGAGGLGREIGQMITQINMHSLQWDLIGYFDDNIEKGTYVKGLEVLGGIAELNKFRKDLNLVIGIADNKIRSMVVSKINNPEIAHPVLIHPSAIFDVSELKMGEGSIIAAGNILTTNIHIGKHSIVNLGCTIGHDVVLGDYCAVMPGVHLSGNINVSKGTLIGTGARVLQNLIIGKNAKVGAGAVVVRDVEEGSTVVGVPAVIVDKH